MTRAFPSLLLAIVLTPLVVADESSWRAGVAKTSITPRRSMWLSGYGGRDRPSEGTLHELWAKALVLEDPGGRRAALVSLDLVGIDRGTSLAVREALRETFGLERRQVALACSHTHTGPVVGDNLHAMYFLDDEQWDRVRRYTSELRERIVETVGRAIDSLAPARLAWTNGHESFAVNRRNNREPDVPRLRVDGRLAGPVDHDVPVLAVRGDDHALRAVVFGYACHATVLSFYQWSGDYPGFAQIELERAHPGAVALFFAGCGADQNPLPRRSVPLAEEYGRRLAEAAGRALGGVLAPVEGSLETRYEEIDLPFDEIPGVERLEEDARSTNRYVARRASLLLERVRAEGRLSPTYPYPVQVWKLGEGLTVVLLGGEVVVDYSLRLKRELGRDTTWVAGYVNDVMAYIPSLRVLREGGYEGEGAMLYYGQPSKWAEGVEELIVEAARRLAR